MRRLFLFVAFLILPFPIVVAAAPTTGGNLYVLGVTLNKFPVKGQNIDSYNWCSEEIEKVFREQARPFHNKMTVLLVRGKQATHAGAMNGLAWLRKNATKKDLVVMYVGAHGNTDAINGWGIVAADGKTLWGREIKAELGKLPCHAIAIIETCTSGGFASAHKNDIPVPANVTALCACTGKQSTDNALDMAVAEGLYGRADFNKDGVVELDELIRYIRLRYKEWWPEPKTTDGSNIPIIVKAKTVTGRLTLTRVSPNLVGAVHNGTWYSALREKQVGTSYQVHFLGWSSKPGAYFLTRTVPRDLICLPADGRPLLVEQKGRWYPARLLTRQGTSSKVHYLGYKEEEVVAANRIVYPFVGDPANPRYPYTSTAVAGAWNRIGPVAAWKDTIAGAVLRDRLYTIESSGALYKTDLSTGTWDQIGKAEFGNTVTMFAAGASLYTIEKDGSLYRVNPKDGSWGGVGPQGGWKDTLAGAVLGGQLFTIGTDGWLYATNLANGNWVTVGKAEFGNTATMFADGVSLYTIEKDGSLYKVNPKDGTWGRVGKEGEWKPTQAATVLKGRLYTVEANGSMYVTALNTGAWKPIGKPEFAGTLAMYAAGNRIFTIEKDGSLFGVSVK